MPKISVAMSPSKFGDYQTCPMQFYYKHVEKFASPMNGAAWLGSSCHHAVEEGIKFMHKNELPEAQKKSIVEEYTVSQFAEKFDHPTDFSGNEIEIDWKDDSPEKLRAKGLQMCSAYVYDPCFDTIKVKAIEEWVPLYVIEANDTFISVPELMPDQLTRTFRQRVDCILENDTIQDFKTSGASWDVFKVIDRLQFDMYAIAYRKQFNVPNEQPVYIRCDVIVKTKDIKIQSFVVPKTYKDELRVLKYLKKMNDAIEAGMFYPTPNALCNNYCAYKDLCRGTQ